MTVLHKPAPRPTPHSTEKITKRLAWLDALRGLAALVVLFEHSLDALLPEVRRTASPWFDFGRYGVYVFFIVSGYVIPASLERRGSVRAFWIGRLFRLYPLWAVATVAGIAFGLMGVFWPLHPALAERPGTAALAHVLMLQDVVGVPNVLSVFWTLSYEMIFYLLVTAMFAAGVHRASGRTAALFGVGAVAFALLLPTGLPFGRGAGTVAAAALLMGVGLVAVASGRRALRPVGITMLGVLALGLLLLGGRIGVVEGLCVLGTMFAGTMFHRLEHAHFNGRARRRRVGLAVALVAGVPALSVLATALLAAGVRLDPSIRPGYTVGWGLPTAIAAAWATFVLMWTLRGHRMPGPLPWLGTISYSLYLLHLLPMQVARRLIGDPALLTPLARLTWGVILLTVVLTLSALAYRYVELPGQRAGRRLIKNRSQPRAEPAAVPAAR